MKGLPSMKMKDLFVIFKGRKKCYWIIIFLVLADLLLSITMK